MSGAINFLLEISLYSAFLYVIIHSLVSFAVAASGSEGLVLAGQLSSSDCSEPEDLPLHLPCVMAKVQLAY